jgi:ankyrin repeat protein
MQAVIDAGADVNAKNMRQATALHWAVGDLSKVQVLLKNGAIVDAKAADGRTALFTAASLPQQVDVVRALLDAGADVHARTIGGVTPLFVAATTSAQMTKLLLDKGADPNAASLSGVRPIMQTRGADVVALLLERGADVNAKSKVNETALMDAAARGDLPAARLLVEKGAEINVADHRGFTPLILAAQYDGDADQLVRFLLARGADASAIAEGETALTLAAKRGDTAVGRTLRQAAAAPPSTNTLAAASPAPLSAGAPVAPERLRAAARKGLDLLLKTSPNFIKTGGCNSCHNQMLPAAAQAFARSRGIAAGEPIAQLDAALSDLGPDRYREYAVGGGGGINGLSFEMFAYAMQRRPADARIAAQIRYIKGLQQPDGHWHAAPAAVAQQSLNRPGVNRSPLTFDDFTPTALMVHALTMYGPPSDAAETKARVEKARAWLLNTAADRMQERAFRLLGLKWAQAEPRAIEGASRSLEALQRPDGGWAQLPTLQSDAYATGVALFALHEAGMAPTHRVYRAGLQYLLTTQASDGTWHVKSRSLEFQPYFESGYPYRRDQWISAAGTAYATMAIAAAVEPTRVSRREP